MNTALKCFLSMLLLGMNIITSAQTGAPQRINYQAVARNSSGVPIANQNISVKAEILVANMSTVLYAETHAVTTNQFGLFTIEVGGGTVVSGSFAAIDWGSGSKYIRTSVDLNAGSNYQVMGTSQFLSVPYALYAENVKNNGGKSIINLTDTVSNAGAQAQLAAELGPNTQEIRILDCQQLTAVDLSMVSELSNLLIMGNPLLTNVNIANLKQCNGDIRVDNNPNLSTLNLSSLEKITSFPSVLPEYQFTQPYEDGHGLTIRNTKLTSLNLPNLKKIAAYVIIQNNTALSSINLPKLESHTFNYAFRVANNKSLNLISLPLITTIGNFNLNGCTSITSLNFPSLINAGAIGLGENSLSAVYLPVLKKAGNINIGYQQPGSYSITTLNLPQLDSVGQFGMLNNSRITAINLPALATAANIFISQNNLLSSVSLPSLTNLGVITNGYSSYITIAGTNLANIDIGNLTSFKSSAFSAGSNLSSTEVNDLLSIFASIPGLTGKTISLNQQNPPAPPTGQGLTDKATLIANGNTVTTD